ncbi:hypothetical protein AB5I41_16390 [Sphingomonas sp. MMS24-JH45]
MATALAAREAWIRAGVSSAAIAASIIPAMPRPALRTVVTGFVLLQRSANSCHRFCPNVVMSFAYATDEFGDGVRLVAGLDLYGLGFRFLGDARLTGRWPSPAAVSARDVPAFGNVEVLDLLRSHKTGARSELVGARRFSLLTASVPLAP